MLQILAAAAAAFIGTNLDDLLILMLLFAQAEDRAGRRRIAAGQFLGIGVLTVVSTLCALGLGRVSGGYLRLLGLIPILLGLRAFMTRNHSEEAEDASAVGVLSTAALTIANGGDNLGVYIPLFAGYRAGQLAVTAAVFALLCGLWCLFAARLAALPRVQAVIRRWKGLLVPAVLILLGVSILLHR